MRRGTLAVLLSSGPSYSADATAVFNRMNTQPPDALKTIMATFIDACVADGNWALLSMFQGRFMDTFENARLDWKGNFNGEVSLPSGVTHVANNSFDYSGSQARGFNLGYNPNSDANWLIGSSVIGTYVLTRDSTTDQRGILGSNSNLTFFQRTVANRLDFLNINAINVQVAGYVGGFTAQRLYTAIGGFSSPNQTITIYENGAQIGSPAGGAGVKNNIAIHEGGRHDSGQNWDGKICCTFAGSATGWNQANFYTRLAAMLTSLGII